MHYASALLLIHEALPRWFFDMTINSFLDSDFLLSIMANRFSFILFGNSEKSHRAKFGEYRCWGMITYCFWPFVCSKFKIQNFPENCITRADSYANIFCNFPYSDYRFFENIFFTVLIFSLLVDMILTPRRSSPSASSDSAFSKALLPIINTFLKSRFRISQSIFYKLSSTLFQF